MAEWSTSQIPLPKNPLEMVIGQQEVVKTASLVARQRRHLFLVGPPGTGKSMIAQAIASLLEPPKFEISVVHDHANPDKPIVELRTREQARETPAQQPQIGKLVPPSAVPIYVSEKLGFRCRHCGQLSGCNQPSCPRCGFEKYLSDSSLFDDLLAIGEPSFEEQGRVRAMVQIADKPEPVFYQRGTNNAVRMLTSRDLQRLNTLEQRKLRKVIAPLDRKTFVQATGASETELLGDIKHDPYGGHPEIGLAPYTRVVPGAVHEAHEGILFIDELSTLGHLQRYLLTAMQEKRFPISARNASSTGACVKVENVPCDFIFVTAVNINDMGLILPQLRSRIVGSGYELLLQTHMAATEANKQKLFQFVAQEIAKDGHIPHASLEACEALALEAKKRAGQPNAYTLRLRGLSGLVKAAGDLAAMDGASLFDSSHVKAALAKSKSIEQQLGEKYDGSWWKAGMADFGASTGPTKSGHENEIA
ncbi:AAA family ATPase [Candidatus Parvarchaeota archaeon]|nr:AAA family ATPase [Candidatus Parvarchaeota archaeon]